MAERIQKISHVLAQEKTIRPKNYSQITSWHHMCQKPDLFSGFTKLYQAKEEGDETFPPESKKVQQIVDEILKLSAKAWTEIFDITATKDWANMGARADVMIGDKVIVKDAPVTWLLFLEKQLNDVRKHIDTLPTLDGADTWTKDDNTGLYKTAPISTHRTKKIQKPIVLYDATKEHPAQAQMVSEDVTIGHWNQVKHSGAIPLPRKKILLDRVDELIKAVKFAREQANTTEAPDVKVGEEVFKYLFAE